jgi:sulfate transport system substrate-binding protein
MSFMLDTREARYWAREQPAQTIRSREPCMSAQQRTHRFSHPRFTARLLEAAAIGLVLLASSAIVAKNYQPRAEVQLLNVSYDPTREVYRELNQRFSERYEKDTGHHVVVRQSHGGSSRQARAVIAGEQAADVVTLGLRSDIEALHKRGLVHDGWGSRLPNNSQPYYSTIVFVVRRGNPSHIRDWPDLVRSPSLEIITPDPKSSGNGKLAALAAWGAIVSRGGSEAEARAYLKALYDHTSFLEAGARGAATAFAVEKLGDVHLTWENEALREVAEAKGDLEIVYPDVSILAEPAVAWVDANVAKNKTEAAARAYLEFLFTDAAQEIIAKHGYRPYKPEILKRHGDRFPDLNLFPITAIAKDWEDAHQRFFADNGIIETVYRPKPR